MILETNRIKDCIFRLQDERIPLRNANRGIGFVICPLWKKILEVVKREKESKVQPTIESVDHYYPAIA